MNIINRSYKIMVALSLIGLIDAIYLTILKLSNNQSLCLDGIGDCWSVNISRYSEIAGIPIAIFGAGAYLAILTVLLFEQRVAFLQENGNLILFGITLVGVLYSAYLTYVEIVILKAICPFCVLSAIVLVGLLIFSINRMASGTPANRTS